MPDVLDESTDHLAIAYSRGSLPGPTLECALEPQEDGSYYGDCVDDDGEIGQLQMIPATGQE